VGKTITFVLIVLIQLALIIELKLLDDFYPIITVISLCALIGLIIRLTLPKQQIKIRNIGWGILYGSITSMLLTIVFIVWLNYNYPQ